MMMRLERNFNTLIIKFVLFLTAQSISFSGMNIK